MKRGRRKDVNGDQRIQSILLWVFFAYPDHLGLDYIIFDFYSLFTSHFHDFTNSIPIHESQVPSSESHPLSIVHLPFVTILLAYN